MRESIRDIGSRICRAPTTRGRSTLRSSERFAGQAPELPRHIRLLLPLLRSRPGGVRSRAIARVPEPVIINRNQWVIGGEGGIRTHGTVSRTQHFQCCQLSRSCTSPGSAIKIGDHLLWSSVSNFNPVKL